VQAPEVSGLIEVFDSRRLYKTQRDRGSAVPKRQQRAGRRRRSHARKHRPDPTRAYVDVRPLDCNGQLATKKATVTWLDRDDKTVSVPFFSYSSGATAVNLPINAARVTRVVARVSETNQLIGMASVVVRPRAVTYLELAPTP
jgi:hypothetical protein